MAYNLFIVDGSGTLVVGGEPYSIGSIAENVSPAEFDTAYFEAGATPGDSEIAVIAIDDLGNYSIAGDMTISVTAPPQQPATIIPTDTTPPTIVAGQALTIGVGGRETLSALNLQTNDANSSDYTPAQLTYEIVSSPQDGYILKGGSIVASFAQADVDNGLISYVQNGTVVSSDQFTYYVVDPAGNRSTNATFNIQVQPPPAATTPVLDTDEAISVGVGQTQLITDANLHVTDSGVQSWRIIYTITSEPTYGQILADGSVPVTYFTQEQVDLGLISYKNNGSSSGPDSFDFTVSDQSGGAIGQTAFNINVIPQNNLSVVVERPITNDDEPDNPVIPGTNTPRAYSLVGQDVLFATDPGVSPQDITYTVQTLPPNAQGFRVGTWDSSGVFTGTAPITTFTQAEVDGGEVFYNQVFGDTDISGDQASIVLSVSDNAGNFVSSLSTQIFKCRPQSDGRLL